MSAPAPTAKGLQDIQDWFGVTFPDYNVSVVKVETLAWRFLILSLDGRSTEVLVPFKPTLAQYRALYRQITLYFTLFGKK